MLPPCSAPSRQRTELDILVNNAGLNVRADFRHLTDAEWATIREVNLDGVVRIARDGFSLLAASKRGSLINIASVLGLRGARPAVAYSATKGAVAALTRGLAVEYAPFGIRVNTVSPGFVRTALTERALRNPAFEKSLIDGTCRRPRRAARNRRSRAVSSPPTMSYCTGSELVVDGGMTASLSTVPAYTATASLFPCHIARDTTMIQTPSSIAEKNTITGPKTCVDANPTATTAGPGQRPTRPQPRPNTSTDHQRAVDGAGRWNFERIGEPGFGALRR